MAETNFEMVSRKALLEIDRKFVIHPYASLINPPTPILVSSAKGPYLHLSTGESVLDGVSSWWSAVHGHNHPDLNNAITQQLNKMAHVMFGGLTHEPAIRLCEKLVEITPSKLQKVFLSDSGSVAVEVAMKTALQYWHNITKSSVKSRFLTIRNGYHGDTFGAMSICDPDGGMHKMFSPLLPKHYFVSSPSSKTSEPDMRQEEICLQEIEAILKTSQDEIAGIMLEPIFQGAGGMYFHSFNFLKALRGLATKYKTLLLFDEIATGFGRTGNLFACMKDKEVVEPDILCLGKALSGGYMTIGATLMSLEICEGISLKPFENSGAFMHGPTFMANPLQCAVSLASVSLLLSSPWQSRVEEVETIFKREFFKLSQEFSEFVLYSRVQGAIGVLELKKPLNKYISSELSQQILLQNKVWLRPFGKIIYAMPPFNAPLSRQEIESIPSAIRAVLMQLKGQRSS